MADGVQDWLESIGFGHFADLFAENGIDLELLPELTNDDLKDIGVGRLADRKLILKAIADWTAASADAGPTLAPPERRQVSILFCDLVGSTELSARLDPEDMRDVLQRYQNAVAEVIVRHGGYVANYLGDGVLAFFGWPDAHEDQTGNATRAGLAAADAVGSIRIPDGSRLAARVGIATGQVVVGDLETETGRQAGAISGDTPNRAARIQGEARPGEVLVDDLTRQLLASQFDVADRGKRVLKGLPGEVRLWQIIDEADGTSRFASRRSSMLTPFVGRDAETARLQSAWENAIAGNAQAACISGEAGIGKSRLIQRLRDLTDDADRTVLQYQCTSYFANTSLRPFIQQLGLAAKFARADDTDERLRKLEGLTLETARPKAQSVPILASLLQVNAGDRYPPLNMSAERLQEETGKVLVEQLFALAARKPVLIVFEDLHWADRRTVELLDEIIGRIAGHPILLVATYRPEFEPPWKSSGNIVFMPLAHLGRTFCRDIAVSAVERDDLPETVLDEILDRTDGIPLYVEELAKAVGEKELTSDRDQGDGLGSVVVPATLQDSLIARLDRLPGVREIAQAGATIGRDFSYDLIAEVSPVGGADLANGLARLVDAGLLYRRGEEPTFMFKHALLRDAAYEGALKSRRRELHLSVAAGIEKIQPEASATQPELLAYHYEAAGVAQAAIRFWIAASQLAAARASFEDALKHADRAVNLLSEIDDPVQRRYLEIGSLNCRAVALIGPHGYGHPDVQAMADRLTQLSAEAADVPELLPSLFWISVFRWTSGDVTGATKYVDRILAIADATEVPEWRVVARGYVGSLLFHVPDFKRSRRILDEAIDEYDPVTFAGFRNMLGQDLGINAMTWKSLRLAAEGSLDQALTLADDFVELARSLSHPFTLNMALGNGSHVASMCREPERQRLWATEWLALCIDQKIAVWREWARFATACSAVFSDDSDVDGDALEASYSVLEETGYRIYWGLQCVTLAACHFRNGNVARCRALMQEGARFVRERPDFYDAFQFHWCRGRLHELIGDPQAALADCRELIELGDRAGANLATLRGTVNAVRLLGDVGAAEKHIEKLRAVTARFIEGHELPDLQEATALLRSLG